MALCCSGVVQGRDFSDSCTLVWRNDCSKSTLNVTSGNRKDLFNPKALRYNGGINTDGD